MSCLGPRLYIVIAEVPESVFTPRIMVRCLILALKGMSGILPRELLAPLNFHPEMEMTMERA